MKQPRFEQIYSFLDRQKKRMLMLDGASEESGWLTPDEQSGRQFVAEDSEDGTKKGMMDMLYTNTINWLARAGTKPQLLRNEWVDLAQNEKLLKEDTTTMGDIATFTTQLLPAIRRIYANLIAMDLVSVQPLAGPTGVLYWMDMLYTSTRGDITAGDNMADNQSEKDYTDSEEQGDIYQIDSKLTSKVIATETKKVATKWTLEAEQDFSSQWHLNLEAELMPELGNSIIREVNRRLLAAIEAGAKNNVDWNKDPLVLDITSADKLAYYQTLWHSISLANSKIVKAKYQPATYLIMNADTFFYLERLNQFKADPNVGQDASTHVRFVGTLSGLYKVYVDPNFTANKIVLSYRGAGWKDSVAYYAPYIPLFLSDRYTFGADFTQIMRGAMSRYAYGVIPESKTQNPVKNGGIATVTLTSS